MKCHNCKLWSNRKRRIITIALLEINEQFDIFRRSWIIGIMFRELYETGQNWTITQNIHKIKILIIISKSTNVTNLLIDFKIFFINRHHLFLYMYYPYIRARNYFFILRLFYSWQPKIQFEEEKKKIRVNIPLHINKIQKIRLSKISV